MEVAQTQSGQTQSSEWTLKHAPGVGPGPSEDLLAELEWEGLSGVWGRLGGHRVCEGPGSADEVSLRWKSRYCHHPHLH